MLLTDPRTSKPAAAWREWEGRLVEDRFRLTQLLGCGGQSAVFLTTRAAGQPAAIKLVLPETEEAGARQLRAWELAAGLAHANLARLFERGDARIDATPLLYVVTEYAEENLAQILPERPLTEKETREMLTPVLAALGYLHGKGFAHGRLTPGNVLAIGEHLKLSGDVVCRFGADCGAGRNGIYDAPELTGGQRTAAADVWSLGVVVREALTQKAEVSAGEKLAAPFAEIVRGCGVRSPENRWSLARIGAALEPEKPAPAEMVQKETAPPVVRQKMAAPAPAPEASIPKSSTYSPSSAQRAPQAAKSETLAGSTPTFLRRSEKPGDAEDGSGRRRLALLGVTAVVVLVVIFAAVKLLHRTPAAEPSVVVPAAASSKASVTAPAAAAPSGAAPGAAPAAAAVHEVVPDVPHAASATIHGTIKVRVRVTADESGRVMEAAITRPGSSPYFAKMALAAAGEWVFAPSPSGGSHTLQFEFKRNGSRAHSVN